MINELFLINDDTLNIFKSKFIKIKELLNINDEKNSTLMFTNIIKTNKINENDKKNSFIKTLETDEDETNKDDQHQEYILSLVLFSLMLLFLSISSSLKNGQEERSVKNAENESFLNIANILFANSSRARKSTHKIVYCLILNEASIKNRKIFYTVFSTFLVIVVSKILNCIAITYYRSLNIIKKFLNIHLFQNFFRSHL